MLYRLTQDIISTNGGILYAGSLVTIEMLTKKIDKQVMESDIWIIKIADKTAEVNEWPEESIKKTEFIRKPVLRKDLRKGRRYLWLTNGETVMATWINKKTGTIIAETSSGTASIRLHYLNLLA